MGKRRLRVHNLFQFRPLFRAALFHAFGQTVGRARSGGGKKRHFPTVFRSPSFPYFTRNSGVFDTPRDNVSPPPKKEPRGEKTAAGRLVSYAQKTARRFVHDVYFSARIFYPYTFCTNRVKRTFFIRFLLFLPLFCTRLCRRSRLSPRGARRTSSRAADRNTRRGGRALPPRRLCR